MARKTRQQFERRKREQDRQARAAARRNRKAARAESKRQPEEGGAPEEEDSDLAGIVAGPQPRDKMDDEEVQRVLERAMNPGKAVRDEPRSRRRGGGSARLFVGNLEFSTNEQELRDYFQEAGFELVEATVVKDRNTGQPRGFAFVELADPDAAMNAIEALDGAELGGRPLRINPADRRS